MEELPQENRSPESAAITGGAPAASEPSPQIRGREATARSLVYVLVVLGVALLLVTIFAEQESDGTAGTLIIGLALLGLAAMRITGLIGPVLLAVLGFVTGIVLTITAFSTEDFGAAQLAMLICGAATFIVSFASLAASRSTAQGDEEAQPGVENV